MGFDAAWAQAATALYDTMGVDATITRPSPYDIPIATRVIWLTPNTVTLPEADFARREPLRVMEMKRADVPTLPRGSRIAAAERAGGPVLEWQVDRLDLADPDHLRVLVTPVEPV